jgi:hypothetical protein
MAAASGRRIKRQAICGKGYDLFRMVEMALFSAISFYYMPQISRFSGLSRYLCTASGRRKHLLLAFSTA